MPTSLNPQSLRTLIQQTLTPLGLYSDDGEELLMATCANESNLGEYRTQGNGGPARGIFQCEGATFNDIWANYLAYHAALATRVKALNGGVQGTVDDLINNDKYAIVICRVHYLRASGLLPACNDLQAIWDYYKKFYNTPQGAATQSVFENKYNTYVLGNP